MSFDILRLGYLVSKLILVHVFFKKNLVGEMPDFCWSSWGKLTSDIWETDRSDSRRSVEIHPISFGGYPLVN